VQLNPTFALWFDVREFQQLADSEGQNADTSLDTSHLQSAISGYAELDPDFYDEWLEAPREELRILFLDTALKLIEQLRTQCEYKTAIELAQKILTVDKANEAAHQHLMFCHSPLGDRAAALDQYESCKRALHEELGIEPSQETRTLYETLLSQTQTKSEAAHLTNLPPPATSFVGRERQVEELILLVAEAPLVTLIGVGGSGKTRLAIQIGRVLVSEFADGVWWVDLAPLTEPNPVPQQVAKALGVQEQP
jgi:DNA-binding SARP family transcriptional activator